ncbi:hypothetical protein IAT38_001115 [Cryptococcus sp. DSM 104549]
MVTSLAVPVAYISVLVTALAIFSRVYRRRQAVEKTSFQPWLPNHPERDIYISLLSAGDTPDALLKSALIARAKADIKRIWRIRDDKIALTNLHQRGLVGDDTMVRFAAAEKELEAEVVDVVSEANTFKQGWGQFIFPTATEMVQADKTKEAVLAIPKIKMVADKRQELRRKYLPNAPVAQTLLEAATQAAMAAAAANGASSSTPSAPTTPAKTPALTASMPQKATPGQADEKAESPAAAGAGSGATTPASTPSKQVLQGSVGKKKGKKK